MNTRNLDVFNSPEVVSYYASRDGITPCERLLFDKYIGPDKSILDLGVGGGRTSSYLSRNAFRYVGVDYADHMVLACRTKFPTFEFRTMDASDLSYFPEMTFDAVVMAFNGLDALATAARLRCVEECHRILKPGGVFIFSSHNPRAVLVRATWSAERLSGIAHNWLPGRKTLAFCALAILTCAAASRALFKAIVQSLPRIAKRIVTKTFWRGEGCWLDQTHGGLIHHYGVPKFVISEVERFGFQMKEVRGDDYPGISRIYFTRWYYYVFSKSDVAPGSETNDSFRPPQHQRKR
jgi:SAM-dependent methyltransferase